MKHISLRYFSAVITLIYIFICFLGAVPAVSASAEGLPDFTAEEKAYIDSHKKLKVGYVQDRIPICFKDENGEAAGISRYIFDRVSEISGLDFEYVALPEGSVTYDYLLKENFDLVTSVEYNEENKKARGILISEPYLSSRKVVVAKENLNFSYDADFTAAVSTGSQTLKKVLAKSFPHFTLKDYESIQDCFDAVDSGSADLMIQNQFVVEYWLNKPKYEKLKVIPIEGLEDKMCFSAVVTLDGKTGVPQEEGEMLIDILDKTIKSMNEDEEGSYIIQGVMEYQYEYTFLDFIDRYRYAVGIFIISALIIISLVILLSRQRIKYAESRADVKAKGRFLSTMSHEIRTPLNGLIGLNNLMEKKIDDKEKLMDYIRQSSVTANYLLSLVNDILDSSKLEEKKLELLLAPISLGLVIETVGSIENSAMTEKKLDFSVDLDMPYPYIVGDEVRIQQILLNLLDNARKFTKEGGSITLTLAQELQSDKVLTTINVKDTGKGMSEDFQEHIFDLFSQELDTVSKGNQGTGLGLSISRQLARLMDGDLTCESKKNVGSCFTFTFLSDTAQPPSEQIHITDHSDKERPVILIAEDNELNGEILIELLKGEGFEADLAQNGKKALEIFKSSPEGKYGVILMDLLMPEMDGFEAAKAIRSLDRDDAKTVKIFACTANSFTEDKEKAFESGMNDLIPKPIDINMLINKLYQ